MKMQRVKIEHEGFGVGQLITGSSRLDMVEEVEIEYIQYQWPPQPLKLHADGKTAIPFTEKIEAQRNKQAKIDKNKAAFEALCPDFETRLGKMKADLDECSKNGNKHAKLLAEITRYLYRMVSLAHGLDDPEKGGE